MENQISQMKQDLLEIPDVDRRRKDLEYTDDVCVGEGNSQWKIRILETHLHESVNNRKR